jgi:hypothetical protein
MPEPVWTPWGKSQTKQKLICGVSSVTTSSHGGLHISEKLNDLIPE